MPYLISTMDGIRIDDMHITVDQIVAINQTDTNLERSIIKVIKPVGETWDIYVHIYDKAGPYAVLMCRPGEVVPEDWWYNG